MHINRLIRPITIHIKNTFPYRHLSYHQTAIMSMDDHNPVPEGYERIIEGQASMLYACNEAVFYNKVQVLNRDLSIQVIRLFAEQRNQDKKARNTSSTTEPGITILDALAATGLRSVRYLKEIPGVSQVIINDLLPAATSAAAENVQRNGVSPDRVTINTGDAIMFMYQHMEPAKQFDVIDLDPYGTASPFLDAAVQAVADGGLLCVTCTDMPVLSGNYPETCYAKYGSISLKGSYHAEMALRILLHSIDSAANRYKRYVVPWVSVAVDFYVRLFVRVYQSPAEVKNSCTRRGHIYQSTQCPTFYIQPMAEIDSRTTQKAKKDHNVSYCNASLSVPRVCEETGGRLKIGGPFWTAPIHNQEVVKELLRRVEEGDAPYPIPTAPRLSGLLTAVSEELPDVPFFYSLASLCAAVNQRTVPMLEFKSALLHAGYRVSNFHKEPLAIKTDAPNSVVWDIVKSYGIQYPSDPPSKKKQQHESSKKILAKAPSMEANFTIHESLKDRKKALRFPPNPEAGWGPKRRAGRPPLQPASTAEKSDADCTSPASKKSRES